MRPFAQTNELKIRTNFVYNVDPTANRCNFEGRVLGGREGLWAQLYLLIPLPPLYVLT